MKKVIIILVLFLSIGCHRIIGYRYSTSGFAVNARGKAMLFTNNGEYLILANLPLWNDSLINRPLTVHGRLMINEIDDESILDSTKTKVMIRFVKYEFDY